MSWQVVFFTFLLSLLPCWTGGLEDCSNLETSLQTGGLNNGTLEVPLGGSRQINFTLSFVHEGTDFFPVVLVDEHFLNIGSNSYVTGGYLQTVRRSCDNSDRPGVTCKLLQLTILGRVGEGDLNGLSLKFGASSGGTDLRCFAPKITIKILEEEVTTTTEAIPTTESTTTQQPTTMATTPSPGVAPAEARKSECRQILTTEIITPWVFVGVLGALELVTAALLIVVICKYRNRETPDKSVTSETPHAMDIVGRDLDDKPRSRTGSDSGRPRPRSRSGSRSRSRSRTDSLRSSSRASYMSLPEVEEPDGITCPPSPLATASSRNNTNASESVV